MKFLKEKGSNCQNRKKNEDVATKFKEINAYESVHETAV